MAGIQLGLTQLEGERNKGRGGTLPGVYDPAETLDGGLSEQNTKNGKGGRPAVGARNLPNKSLVEDRRVTRWGLEKISFREKNQL